MAIFISILNGICLNSIPSRIESSTLTRRLLFQKIAEKHPLYKFQNVPNLTEWIIRFGQLASRSAAATRTKTTRGRPGRDVSGLVTATSRQTSARRSSASSAKTNTVASLKWRFTPDKCRRLSVASSCSSSWSPSFTGSEFWLLSSCSAFTCGFSEAKSKLKFVELILFRKKKFSDRNFYLTVVPWACCAAIEDSLHLHRYWTTANELNTFKMTCKNSK